MKTFYSILILLFIFSCSKKEEDLLIVTAHSVTYKSALLNWNNVFPNAENSIFQVFFNKKPVVEFENVFSYELNNLEEETTYSGYVTANDTINNTSHIAYYSFTTLKNSPPGPFDIDINFITENSISIKWPKPYEPDRDIITYDLIINEDLIQDKQTVLYDTITGLHPNTSYSLTVSAKDEQGNEQKESVSFKTMAEGAEIKHLSETFGNIEREYGVYIPPNPSTEELPLVVFVHGATGIVWPDMITDDFVSIAEEETFVLLKPQGRFNCDGESCWGYDDDTDPNFISQLIDSVIVRYNIDIERVYLSGHSNGAFITYYMADYIEDKLAAIGPIAGTLGPYQYNRFHLNKPMPLCHIHGTDDTTVPVDGNATHVSFEKILEFWIPNNNVFETPIITELPDIYQYDNSTVTKLVYNTINESSGDIVYYRINDGNHSIPGIQSWSNKDIHAYKELWNFFKTRKLSDK